MSKTAAIDEQFKATGVISQYKISRLNIQLVFFSHISGMFENKNPMHHGDEQPVLIFS